MLHIVSRIGGMMKQTIWTGTCAAIVTFAAAAIFAQTPAQPPAQQPPQPPAPQASTPSTSDKKITVTGCLKAAPPMTADAAGTTGTTAPSPTAAAGAPTAGATGTSGAAESKFILTGASATPAEAATAQTYRLIANPTALSEHVGKKLELVGTIETTSTPDPKDPSAAAPAFKVESGKIVAATCSE
jgi:hypothetical protein